MYRLYYHHKTNGDILFLVIDPESYPDKVEKKDDVVALYKEGKLVGINFLSIGKTMKVRAEGMIVFPDDKVIDVLNDKLALAGLEKLPYVRDSGYKVALIEKKEEHPLDERMSILTLSIGEKKLSTVTRYANIEEGDKIVIALDGCLRFDGSAFHARVERNIPIEAEVCSEADLRLGEESKKALVVSDKEAGEDYFL